MILEILIGYLIFCYIYTMIFWAMYLNPVIVELNKFYSRKIGLFINTIIIVITTLLTTVLLPIELLVSNKLHLFGVSEDTKRVIVTNINKILQDLNKEN